MPQPKSSSPRTRKNARAAAPARDDDNVTRLTTLRDVLARAIMLPTERVRETLDDAVRRGRMTRSDAEDLAQTLIGAGRRQAESLLADLEQLLGRPRPGGAADARARNTQQGGERTGGFPIADYDDLAAAQITSRLDDLTPAELRKVRDYERRHGNRKTVLSAVERKLG